MKNAIVFLFFAFSFQMIFSQNAFTLDYALDRLDYFKNDTKNLNPEFINARGQAVNVGNVDGSIYLNDEFAKGKIHLKESEQTVTALMRYRIYDDKFEIKRNTADSETITLPRSDKYTFDLNGMHFVFLRGLPVPVGGSYSGYAMELVGLNEGKAGLYKRLGQKYHPPEKSATPLGYSANAELENEKYYFLEIAGKLYVVEPHRRKAAEAFPDKNKELEKYIDENKLKFRNGDEETDLVQLVNYYNSL